MKVFGERVAAERRILTFAPAEELPAPPRLRALSVPPRDEGLMGALAEAARDADLAEHELDRAKAAYALAPTKENLDALRAISLRTLAAEAAFDRAWQAASATWFGHPGQS